MASSATVLSLSVASFGGAAHLRAEPGFGDLLRGLLRCGHRGLLYLVEFFRSRVRRGFSQRVAGRTERARARPGSKAATPRSVRRWQGQGRRPARRCRGRCSRRMRGSSGTSRRPLSRVVSKASFAASEAEFMVELKVLPCRSQVSRAVSPSSATRLRTSSASCAAVSRVSAAVAVTALRGCRRSWSRPASLPIAMSRAPCPWRRR